MFIVNPYKYCMEAFHSINSFTIYTRDGWEFPGLILKDLKQNLQVPSVSFSCYTAGKTLRTHAVLHIL